MENVEFERFTVDGELWTPAPIGKYAGTSPKGIWTIFTNGKQKFAFACTHANQKTKRNASYHTKD